ncbi:Beta-peptidyl aminopeptidase BapA [subsurface metagenome]
MVDLRELGYNCGKYPTGKNNAITDVSGVAVGHETIIKGEGKHIIGEGPIRTGVTVILPHEGNIYADKVVTGVHIVNAYGKSTGIPQIFEMGCIETPIAITNTLNVGLVFDALVSYSISRNLEDGITPSSISPIVTECNDGFLNDIQGRHVKESHVLKAIQNAKSATKIEQGCVGAGTGMRVFGLKSGIGTASRQLNVRQTKYQKTYHIGTLVVPNYGSLQDFQFYGTRMATILDKKKYFPKAKKKRKNKISGGSIIVIIATDLPLTHRQLNRLSRRGAFGIARTGSIIGHSSGDFLFAFSTSSRIEHNPKDLFKERLFLNENNLIISDIFRMTIDAVQEAIYNAMLSAETMVGRDDNVLVALDPDDLPNINQIS